MITKQLNVQTDSIASMMFSGGKASSIPRFPVYSENAILAFALYRPVLVVVTC